MQAIPLEHSNRRLTETHSSQLIVVHVDVDNVTPSGSLPDADGSWVRPHRPSFFRRQRGFRELRHRRPHVSQFFLTSFYLMSTLLSFDSLRVKVLVSSRCEGCCCIFFSLNQILNELKYGKKKHLCPLYLPVRKQQWHRVIFPDFSQRQDVKRGKKLKETKEEGNSKRRRNAKEG